MRKGRMYGQFENFKINENLFGKPLNRDWVAGVVFSYTFGGFGEVKRSAKK